MEEVLPHLKIGILKKIIALNLNGDSFIIFNPRITYRSPETFLLWDDCISFPDHVVKVERNKSIDLTWQNELGEPVIWKNLPPDQSELLQHETDHLHGILALKRAFDDHSILQKKDFLLNQGYYRKQVRERGRKSKKEARIPKNSFV